LARANRVYNPHAEARPLHGDTWEFDSQVNKKTGNMKMFPVWVLIKIIF